MSTYTVHVSAIAPATTEANLNDFFSFCGKISAIDFTPEKQTAVIHFEKPSAAKTALMLNGGTLDGAHLSVTSEIAHEDEDRSDHKAPVEQSDKPRAGIAAEYLAKGYVLSDHILERAIDIDNKQGISKRFLNYLNSLDTTIGAKALGPDQTISGKVQATLGTAHQKAKSVDEQKGYSKTAFDYYTKALSSPIGQKVRAFYTTTSKQVLDIHEEARRLADQHAAPAASTTPAAPATETTPAPAVAPVTPAAPTTV